MLCSICNFSHIWYSYCHKCYSLQVPSSSYRSIFPSYVSLEHYKALQEGMKYYNIKENKQTRNPSGSDTSRKALVWPEGQILGYLLALPKLCKGIRNPHWNVLPPNSHSLRRPKTRENIQYHAWMEPKRLSLFKLA